MFWRKRFPEPPPPRPRHEMIQDIKNEFSRFQQAMRPYYYRFERLHGTEEADFWYQRTVVSVEKDLEEAIEAINRGLFFDAMRLLERNRSEVDGTDFFTMQYFTLKSAVQYEDYKREH